MPGYGQKGKSSGLVTGKFSTPKKGFNVYMSMSGPKQGRKKKYAKKR